MHTDWRSRYACSSKWLRLIQGSCLTHWFLITVAEILQKTFSKAFSWKKMLIFWLKFHWIHEDSTTKSDKPLHEPMIISFTFHVSISVTRDPFYKHRLTLIPGWISNYIHYKVWGEITFPFPIKRLCSCGSWEWISNVPVNMPQPVLTGPEPGPCR